MQERIRLLENGEVLEIAYIMTDPVNWKGEWRSTKYLFAWDAFLVALRADGAERFRSAEVERVVDAMSKRR